MSTPSLGLFISYLCDLFFIFSLILIADNHKSVIKTDSLVCYTRSSVKFRVHVSVE